MSGSIEYNLREILTKRFSALQGVEAKEVVSGTIFMTIFSNKVFGQLIGPLIAVCVSVFLKCATRQDSHQAFRKEDLAFGFDLAVTALLLFISAGAKFAQAAALKSPPDPELYKKIEVLPWTILALVMGIWGASFIVRKIGWEKEGVLHVAWGLWVPNCFGFFALLVAVEYIQ